MSSGEDHFRELGGGNWIGALEIITEELGRGATRFLADAFNFTGRDRLREPQRWLVGAGIRQARQGRSAKHHENKLIGLAAALRLRGMSGARIDGITVTYLGKDAGDRNIAHITGTLQFQGEMGTARDAAASALEKGDFEKAAEEFAKGVLDEYGGLGDSLGISDYTDGIEWEE